MAHFKKLLMTFPMQFIVQFCSFQTFFPQKNCRLQRDSNYYQIIGVEGKHSAQETIRKTFETGGIVCGSDGSNQSSHRHILFTLNCIHCLLIGRFLKVPGDKVPNKSSPNLWRLFGLF